METLHQLSHLQTVYRILTRIESMFSSLQEVNSFCQRNYAVQPTIPSSAMPDEDRTTSRICVGTSLESCVTAIGTLGVFRRCLASNPDTKSYASLGREVYPIILQTFLVAADFLYKPTVQQVPDVNRSEERWLLKPVSPVSSRILWLDMFSITLDPDDCRKAVNVCEVGDPVGMSHPWLDGRGHVLDCSEMEE